MSVNVLAMLQRPAYLRQLPYQKCQQMSQIWNELHAYLLNERGVLDVRAVVWGVEFAVATAWESHLHTDTVNALKSNQKVSKLAHTPLLFQWSMYLRLRPCSPCRGIGGGTRRPAKEKNQVSSKFLEQRTS